MKVFLKIIVLGLIVNSSFLVQRKVVDILIFKINSIVPEYPYLVRYDSLQAKIKVDVQKEASKDSNTIIDYFQPEPNIYASLDNHRLTLHEYLDRLKGDIPEDYFIVVKLKIEWDGQITEGRIIAHEGSKPDIKLLRKIVSHLKAKPIINEAGFPNPGPNYINLVIKGKNRISN